jgi:hypothetical protein
MEIQSDLKDLKKASDTRRLRGHLRPAGIGSIIFGIFAIYLGVEFAAEHVLNQFLIFLGIFLILEGVWIIIKPRPSGMIIDGIALLTIGGWNLLISFAALEQAGPFLVLGIFQIIWGIQSISQYGKFKNIETYQPTPALLSEAKILTSEVIKGNPKKAENIIDFKAKKLVWKAGLAANGAVIVQIPAGEAFFVAKEDFKIERVLPKKKGFDVSIELDDQKFSGFVTEEQLQKFESWIGAS